MKIITESIKNNLEMWFGKPIDAISSKDIETITSLNVCGIDSFGNQQTVNLDELNLFESLNSISIENLKMTNEELSKLKKYKKINFKNCVLESLCQLSVDMESLRFDSCIINDYDGLEKFKSLISFQVSRPFDGPQLSVEKIDFPILEDLELSGVPEGYVSDYSFLQRIENLRQLYITDTNFSLDNLKSNKHLENVYLSDELYDRNSNGFATFSNVTFHRGLMDLIYFAPESEETPIKK